MHLLSMYKNKVLKPKCSPTRRLNVLFYMNKICTDIVLIYCSYANKEKVVFASLYLLCYLCYLYNVAHTQETRGTDPSLDQCWATVYDAGPTLIQQ